MSYEELAIGDEVKVYEKGARRRGKERITGYFLKVRGKIASIAADHILVEGSYKEYFKIVEFRLHLYRLFRESGEEIKFASLPDRAKIDEMIKKNTIAEYYEQVDHSRQKSIENQKSGTAATTKRVIELFNQGMDPDDIVKELNSNPWTVKGLLSRNGLIPKHTKIKKESEDEKVLPKITSEQLYQEVKLHGTGKDALNGIAGRYGLKVSTLNFYLTEWGINKRLKDEGIITIYSSRGKKAEKPSEEKQDKNETTAEQAPVSDTKITAESEKASTDEQKQVLAKCIIKGCNNMVSTGTLCKEHLSDINSGEALIGETAAKETIATGSNITMGEPAHIDWPSTPEPEKNLNTIEDEEQLQLDRDALTKRKSLLRPKCMVGEATAREYVYSDSGIKISGDFISWSEIDDVIAELQEIKAQRIA